MKLSEEHSDAVFYEIAMGELHIGKLNRALMAKAITKSKGNEKEGEALYLEWRVEALKALQDEAIAELKRELKRRKSEKFSGFIDEHFSSKFIFWFLVLLVIVLAIIILIN
tara:strand:+ start:163 stop:495 length:333 start_codon:yes stop_codon:yes gene_type:complete